MATTKRILSIDWDFFCELAPDLDWSHRESDFFLTAMWAIRQMRVDTGGGMTIVPLETLVPFRGDEAKLYGIPFRFPSYQLFVAESHATIYQAVPRDWRNLEIHNIDAHHDIWYRNPIRSAKHLDCGSWGSLLINERRVRAWHQYYPNWRTRHPEDFKDAFDWATEHRVQPTTHYDLPNFAQWRKVDLVFICRSGCWAPPCYDDRFNALCKALGADDGLLARQIEAPHLPDLSKALSVLSK